MTLEVIRNMLGWCTLINFGILLLWFVMMVPARGVVHGIHGKMFRLAPEQMDEIHYRLMAQFKMLVIVFCLVPYLALRIVG
ncbi:MAG: hypothetical protein DRJ50_13190 [Actinobacteria bacterium]|nr:MAG: hypothetical protein DRJ50_13190 [Actinomycetota bacterium]